MKKKKEKNWNKNKNPKEQEQEQKIQNPQRLFFNLTLSLPLTFRVSLFLPHFLLSSSDRRGTDRRGTDRRGLVFAHG